MARPIWTGTLSFGLLNVPVSLMAGQRSVDLHFRMLDSRNNTPVRYERVNAETGEEVPWKDIVKAFEYKKGSYVVLEPDDIKSAASEGREAVEVEAFVDAASIGPAFYEKPYVLVPGKKAEKGYVLLRETLAKTGRIGIARVVIRTKEYLAAVRPDGDALMLLLMRWPEELVARDAFALPHGALSSFRITEKEQQMAKQLVDAMAGEWKPEQYEDDFAKRLRAVIRKKMKSKGALAEAEEGAEREPPATNVVDFMALLRDSIASNKRSPAGKAKTPARRRAARKRTARTTHKRKAG
ncbi:Ku protein [Dyella sp.]|uniref:non-homologous end joining protein Ku n=1 Tax=Dyella sp. TaxID=1869338 RepID=UPI002D76DD64|nr:Ku protein [Dyella sp.]HET6432776.1 Ku protein [Dyella sp.]